MARSRTARGNYDDKQPRRRQQLVAAVLTAKGRIAAATLRRYIAQSIPRRRHLAGTCRRRCTARDRTAYGNYNSDDDDDDNNNNTVTAISKA